MRSPVLFPFTSENQPFISVSTFSVIRLDTLKILSADQEPIAIFLHGTFPRGSGNQTEGDLCVFQAWLPGSSPLLSSWPGPMGQGGFALMVKSSKKCRSDPLSGNSWLHLGHWVVGPLRWHFFILYWIFDKSQGVWLFLSEHLLFTFCV